MLSGFGAALGGMAAGSLPPSKKQRRTFISQVQEVQPGQRYAHPVIDLPSLLPGLYWIV